MKAEKDHVVRVHYTLREGNAQGQLIEQTDKDDPFEFLVGHSVVLPRFEEAILGKTVGERFSVHIAAEDAYGPIIEEAKAMRVEKSAFGLSDPEEEEAMLQEGHILPMRDQEGNVWQGRIIEVHADYVIMDLNDELAGIDLYYEGEIADIRPATEEELSFGEEEEGDWQ